MVLSTDSDTKWEFIDGSYVKAYQPGTGAASLHPQAIGLSRGGHTSKVHDNEVIRDKVRERHSTPVIPRKKNSKTSNADIDWCLYKYKYLVETPSARLKHFSAIAT